LPVTGGGESILFQPRTPRAVGSAHGSSPGGWVARTRIFLWGSTTRAPAHAAAGHGLVEVRALRPGWLWARTGGPASRATTAAPARADLRGAVRVSSPPGEGGAANGVAVVLSRRRRGHPRGRGRRGWAVRPWARHR